MNKLEINIPPEGFELIMAVYTLRYYTRDISTLVDPNATQDLKDGARLRVEYYTALLRYTAARCARAAAGNYIPEKGHGPCFPDFYLKHSMGDAFNEDLVANDWEELQKMCPHLMGWQDNDDGTETCNGCNVTVVSKTKHNIAPQIVETPPKPKPEMVVGKSYDCQRCHRRHPPGPCENYAGLPISAQ